MTCRPHEDEVRRARSDTSDRREILPFCGALAAFSLLCCGGCYEHVVNAPNTAHTVKEVYEPNVEEQGPSWIDVFMWGDPPKGQDARSYYRQKNSMGLAK